MYDKKKNDKAIRFHQLVQAAVFFNEYSNFSEDEKRIIIESLLAEHKKIFDDLLLQNAESQSDE